MFPKIDDPAAWNAQALDTCQTDRDALDWYRTQGIYTVSIDEQTRIQARERIAADLLPQRGMLARREYESIRHGTLARFGNLHIATGEVLSAMIHVTRTEEDSLENMDGLVCTNRATQWHFVTDNLNTHTNIITIQCPKFLRYIAAQCGIEAELGAKIVTASFSRCNHGEIFWSP